MNNKWLKFWHKALNQLRYHPSAFLNRATANILLPILPEKSGEIVVNGIRFHIDAALGHNVKEMRYGYYETELTELLKKYIRKGDLVIDVGANIGFISAFMLGLVGESGDVHSFEPVPEYFERLKKVKDDNPQFTISVNAMAMGDQEGTSKICVSGGDNIGWNTLVPNFMNKKKMKAELEIPVRRLDSYLEDLGLNNVRLIKIDTEGYEFPVLKGLKGYLESAPQLPILIVEIAPNAYPKLGLSLEELEQYMQEFGYACHDIITRRPVNVSTLGNSANVIFRHPKFH